MARTLIHQAPPKGQGLTPCCHRTPFELPTHDRITQLIELVTCKPRESTSTAAVVLDLVDGEGDPLTHGDTIAQLVNDVVATIRRTGRAQHVTGTEALAQVVAARLTQLWMPAHHD